MYQNKIVGLQKHKIWNFMFLKADNFVLIHFLILNFYENIKFIFLQNNQNKKNKMYQNK